VGRPLSAEWIDHLPDNWVRGRLRCGRVLSKTLCAEPDCLCGIQERHIHCKNCGRIVSRGDWNNPGITLGHFTLPKRDWV